MINNIWQTDGQISTFQAPLLVGGGTWRGATISDGAVNTNFSLGLVTGVSNLLRWRNPVILKQIFEFVNVWYVLGISKWITSDVILMNH